MWSPLRKAVGAATPGYLGEWHAFRQYFTGVGPQAREAVGLVRARPAARLRVVVPAPGRTGQRRLRHPAIGRAPRRARRPRAGDEGRVARPARPPAHRRSVLGADARPEAPHRAWPIPARVDSTRAHVRARAVRRRCRVRDRSADRRRHRAGTAHRDARRRGRSNDGGPVRRRLVRRPPTKPSVRAHAVRRPPHVRLLVRVVRHRRGARAGAPPRVAHPVDGAELRPLAVRGLPPGARRHAPALAPRRCSRHPARTLRS